jgi:hypothetical protein
LFLVVTACCVWLAIVVNRANRQREGVAAIKAMGGSVLYDVELDEEATRKAGMFPKSTLRRWLPRDYTDQVVMANLHASYADDSSLAHLRLISGLRDLGLGRTRVTNAGLVHLRALTRLRAIDLQHTQVGDAGLIHLAALPNLQTLVLSDTELTDAGMPHLLACTELKYLNLDGTRITDAGVVLLRACSALTYLNLDHTQVTDVALNQLVACRELQYLSLHFITEVTDSGIDRFKAARPDCHVSR